MTDFSEWRLFNYDDATIQLWVFKKSSTAEKFRAWHVRTDQAIETLFRSAIKSEIERITESATYSPIAQTNENSCLAHSLEHSDGVIALFDTVDRPENENTDAQLKHLKGAAGYVVKFQVADNIVYAVRKTAPTWKPKVRKSFINAIFRNGELSATPEESFSFDSYYDFYGFNETIFMASKRSYETIVSDKQIYEKSFTDLAIDSDFAKIFNNVVPLQEYVGNNAMQLRRIAVINEKGLYRDDKFCSKLKKISSERKWGLNFDANDKLIVCTVTARTIMQVLLDHRLLSEITEITYDVPDAEAV